MPSCSENWKIRNQGAISANLRPKTAKNGHLSAYFPDHHLIPKNTCPEGAETPRVKNFGEVGPLPPSLDWTTPCLQ